MTLTSAPPAGAAAAPGRSFRRQMAVGIALLVVVLAALGWISSSVPVRLASASPGDGTSVDSPPGEVVLDFSGEFGVRSVFVRVTGEDGVAVDRDRPSVDGGRITAPVAITGPGTYRVTYRLDLGGQKEVSGVTGFTVGPAGSAPATARPATAAAADGHDHGTEGAWNIALLCLDAVLLPAALVLMLRRPRVRRSRQGGQA